MSEHWSAWDDGREGPQTDVEQRAWDLCQRFGLNGLRRVVFIRVVQFIDLSSEPCWLTDSQLADSITDEIGRHPHPVSVRRARTSLEKLGLLKCEQLRGNSSHLGPPAADGLIHNDREFAQAYGTTLKTVCWHAVPNHSRRTA